MLQSREGTSQSGCLAWRGLEPFGIEIACDLSTPLRAADRTLFRELFYAHGLIVARDQRLGLEEQIRVVGYIEPVERFADNVTYISTDPSEGLLGEQALPFHADLVWTAYPRRVSSLHAIELRDGSSYTEFTHGAHRYAGLPAPLKAELAGVVALHVLSDRLMTDELARGAIAMGRSYDPEAPHARHPAVLEHPVTKQPVLLVTETDTVALEGLEPDRMCELAERLFGALYDPKVIHRHTWRQRDFVVWDNLALQHSRGSCRDVGRRTLQAVAAQPKALVELDPRAGGASTPERDYGRRFGGVGEKDSAGG